MDAHSLRVLWLVNAAILLAFVKVFEIPPLIPVLATDLGIDYAQAGIFMTAYGLVRCVGSSPAGWLADRYGALPVICGSLLCLGVCGLLGTVGSNYGILLALRVLVSLGVAAIFIAAIDAIPKSLPPEQVGTGMGLVNVSLNVGITGAMLLTPILAQDWGWRWTARAYSIACLALFVLALAMLRRPPSRHPRVTSQEHALSFADLLANPLVLLLAAASAVLFVELYGVLTWVPAYLQDVRGFDGAQVGASAMTFGLAAIPASMATGVLCRSLRSILWLTVSGGLACGAGILALTGAAHLTPLTATALIALLTWGHTQVIVTIMSLASLVVPSHSTGRALGIVFTVGYGGSIVSTWLGGWLVTRTGEYDSAFAVFAVAAFLSIVFMATVQHRLARRPPAHFALAR